MRARYFAISFSVALFAPAAQAESSRSAAIRQVTSGETLPERSAAGFDQIATIDAGRGKVDQIDPALAMKVVPESDRLETDPEVPSTGCSLTREQQAIVTSLQAQGKLPVGDCEMIAWFARPGDQSEGEERALAEAAAANAPELLGQEAERDRAARLEAEQQQADAAAVSVSTTIFTPVSPAPPGK